MSTFKLYDPAKKGTLILAGPRYGSHFLAQVIHNKLTSTDLYESSLICEAELGHKSYHFVTAIDELKHLEQQNGYQIAILNVLPSKLMLVAYPALAKDWHIVRITHDNKVHWFKSYWYFLVANNPKFDHHSTSIDVYENFLKEIGKIELTDQMVNDTTSLLSQTLVNQHIDCDEHIRYTDLPFLSNESVLWKQNNYPNLDITEMFTNSEEFNQLLTNWPKEVLSAIR